VTLERARSFANSWGSTFVGIGDAGHINSASALGDWPRGRELLSELVDAPTYSLTSSPNSPG
jgi:hypothetical protein